ncbi:hypothetical protein C922_02759 [Plasmodium inui San Antonio 1]|uniref:Uncharacterized protein n=1 Tax=Plasmodium inui San Antonio 1 TaxID=1237626 RepID=W7ACG2_9APIC|nr:hypothetical protein C922_02759 [Plasmodium inui San Antonio 1]EUD66774.1 hypothetical protein C922_02759 [Plasmodium inui San Antonio 1]
MENNQFSYILRRQIQDIFAECSVSNEKGGLQDGDSSVGGPTQGDDPDKQMNFPRGKNRIDQRGLNGHDNTGWIDTRPQINLKKEEDKSIFGHDGKILMVQSYTSLLYEHCQDKVNVVLANRTMHEGRIEMQISGQGESFTLPARLDGNILSSFSPQLKKGVYNLFFFINKEMIYSKLLSCGVNKLSRGMPCLPLHVIEISSSGHVAYCREIKKLPPYNIRVNNHVHTNKGLLKLYALMHKQYSQMANQEGIRDGRVSLGTDYQLHTSSDSDFYDLLSAYKDAYTNHHPYVHGKKGKKEKLYINNIPFLSALNFVSHLEQCRIPPLYKKLLYDQCAYGDKVAIMRYHTRLAPGNYSSGGLCAHVFAKDQLGGSYSVFAFDLVVPGVEKGGRRAIEGATTTSKAKTEYEPPAWTKKNPPVSSLLRFSCNQDSCADMRQWSYVEAIHCRKNDVARKFYLSKGGKRGTNVEGPVAYPVTYPLQCPVPVELINNRNAFKRYAPGIRLSERASLFFEAWDCDILPVGPFVPSADCGTDCSMDCNIHCNRHCEKVCAQMRNLSTLVRSARGDTLSFDDLCEEGQKRDVIKSGGTEKRADEVEKNEQVGKGQEGKGQEDGQGSKEEEDGQGAKGPDDGQGAKKTYDEDDTKGEKRQSSPRRAESKVRPQDEQLKCATKQTQEEAGSKCPLSTFVSFVITIDGKIYHSVLPISRLLLLFVVNYWMYFAD